MELWVDRRPDNTKASFENHNDIHNKQSLLKKKKQTPHQFLKFLFKLKARMMNTYL